MKIHFILLFVSSIIFSSPSFALTIGVPGTKPTIQAGIDAASPGDTVLVQPGTYYEVIDFKGKNIVVGSMWLATRDSSYIINTIINATQMNTVVAFKNGETEKTELCGFTLTGGKSQANAVGGRGNIGGGIYCLNSSPYLHHLIVDRNISELQGGGMYLENSNSVIEYCVIRNNGGALGGGGFWIAKGNCQIKNCIINNNGGGGGGIFCENSNILLFRVLFYKNLSNHVIVTNTSTLNIINCTIAQQYSYTLQIFYSDVNIINSIFWNDLPQIRISDSPSEHPELPISSITVAFSDIKGGKDKILIAPFNSIFYDNNIDTDPLFINLSNSGYNLSKGSPCIDSGIAFYKVGDVILLNLKKEDYNGNAPDIGAFESYTSTAVRDFDVNDNVKLSNYPNPFNDTTMINYSISKENLVHLAIYNITGQKVADLLDKSLSIGNYKIKWNGTDKFGNKISSGVYIIKLDAGINHLSQSIVYMK